MDGCLLLSEYRDEVDVGLFRKRGISKGVFHIILFDVKEGVEGSGRSVK